MSVETYNKLTYNLLLYLQYKNNIISYDLSNHDQFNSILSTNYIKYLNDIR